VSGYINSSPRLFRLVNASGAAWTLALLLLAAVVPAPLDAPADPSHPPNPAKSAWFLLWIQELVSHGNALVYVAVAVTAALVALPWLPVRAVERASWFPAGQRGLALVVLLLALVVLWLTAVGLWMRGPDWTFVPPF
jgi:hypothetical protein